MQKPLIDKLMDVSERHAEKMADLWYKSVCTNARTSSILVMPREGCLRLAASIYKSLSDMYFADNCYETVEHTLDVCGFAEDFFARNIPLEEVLYAMILLRRQIWLYADSQAVFSSSVMDMYNALDCINRVLLVFDYASYIVVSKYRHMANRANKEPVMGKQSR
jgi:hypothetical protein